MNFKEKLKIKKEDFKIPVMKVTETFKKETWLIGEDKILSFLQEKRLINLGILKKESPWTQQGITEVDKIIEKVEYLFKYPKVN